MLAELKEGTGTISHTSAMRKTPVWEDCQPQAEKSRTERQKRDGGSETPDTCFSTLDSISQWLPSLNWSSQSWGSVDPHSHWGCSNSPLQVTMIWLPGGPASCLARNQNTCKKLLYIQHSHCGNPFDGFYWSEHTPAVRTTHSTPRCVPWGNDCICPQKDIASLIIRNKPWKLSKCLVIGEWKEKQNKKQGISSDEVPLSNKNE